MVYFSRFRGTQQVSVAHATSRVADAITDVVRNLFLTRLQDSSWKISQIWIPLPAAFSPVYIFFFFGGGDQIAIPYSIHSPSFSTHILAVYILQSLSLWFKWSTPDGLPAGFEEDEAPDPPPGEHWQEFDSLQQVVLKLGDIHQIPTLQKILTHHEIQWKWPFDNIPTFQTTQH